jgi:hypothetical protein
MLILSICMLDGELRLSAAGFHIRGEEIDAICPRG